MRKLYFILSVALLCSFVLPSASAQYLDSPTSIYVFDKTDNTILIGAHVTISSGKNLVKGVTEKYNSVSNTFARFECDKYFLDSVTLNVTYIGYKPYQKRFSSEEFSGARFVYMEQDTMTMSQIIVVGDRVAMVVKGDTTIYNASAFKTMEGDRFVELIRQLPGVELRDGKIYANGEPIKRVYVDGRNFFGANVSYALTDLVADDVKQVKVYEQQTAEAVRLDDNTAPKETVMNVETYSKPKIIQGGSVELSGGMSFEEDYSGRHEVRHSEALSLYRNSESNNIRLNASNSKNDAQKDGA